MLSPEMIKKLQLSTATKPWVRYELSELYVELYFDHIPDEKTREILKTYNWRWYGVKHCWSGWRSPENIKLAQSICKLLNPPKEASPKSYLQSLPRFHFDEYSLIIRSNSLYCNTHHELEDMAGEISICDRSGNIFPYLIPIVYCKTCDLYFALESTYRTLKKKGHILCQVTTYTDYKTHGAPNMYSNSLKAESLLHALGYNVSQSEDLSQVQRHVILESIIDSGILTKDRILSYLDFFISLRDNSSVAVEKWKEDRNYIAGYRLGSNPKVPIGKIIIIERV